MKTKAEIVTKLEQMGILQFADIKARNNVIFVPPHRIVNQDWSKIADELEAFGFEGRGTLAMSIHYSDAEDVPNPWLDSDGKIPSEIFQKLQEN